MNTVPAKITNRISPHSLPESLQTLERHLKQIQQEQLSKNQAQLRGLTCDQQQAVELLTMAIIRRILEGIVAQWEVCSVADTRGRASAIVTSLWKLGGATGDREVR
ncbi:MAG: hypothetical protein HY647_02380 [Acidobacteria bacterium]|nr:hypothetical protein [Acidobacteriota bacterium]